MHKPEYVLPHTCRIEDCNAIIDEQGRPWWVAKEVCDLLDLTNPSVSVASLDDDERAKFNLGRQGKAWIINESGIYSLIIRSRKPEAKTFKRWITHIVIPEIRKTGGYLHATADMTDEEIMSRALLLGKKKIDELQGQIQDMLPKAEGFDHFIDTDMLVNQQ